jgi:hypothetical protein
MKNNLILFTGLLFSFGGFISCDKVEFPNVIITDLDTNLYPGNFIDYDFPDFEANTNTLRNVLIEDYTGHQCPFCPNAAEDAEAIEALHPERVFVASIHATPSVSGTGTFQAVNASFPRDYTNPQGKEMASTFFQAEVGFSSNPSGNINRIPGEDGFYFFDSEFWGARTALALATSLSVNIQAKSTYFPETNGAYIHTETEFLTDLTGNYNMVIYALENETVSPQKMPDGSTNATYVHHDIHLGNLFGETWGRPIATGSIASGTKVKKDFSYTLPEGLTKEEMHFLVIVFNRTTYEVMQVIKHEL